MLNSMKNNLSNLHAFWSVFEKQREGMFFQHKGWPNKVWRADFSSKLSDNFDSGIYVTNQLPSSDELELYNSNIVNHLIAMQLKMKTNTDMGVVDENIKPVHNETDLALWAQACADAFGYEIECSALVPLLQDENACIFSYLMNGDVAGTAITYQTGSVIGIHQVGVMPHLQGLGIGRKLMSHILAYANKKECTELQLQASTAGLPLYVDMGFKKLGDFYHIASNAKLLDVKSSSLMMGEESRA